MKQQLYIRVDDNSEIGLGHLYRCFSLAQMLISDFKILFYCQFIPQVVENEFTASGVSVCKIFQEEDFLNNIKRGVIVVLDGYSFKENYQIKIKQKGAILVCIDDIHEQSFFADLIINHSPGVIATDYKSVPYTQFALGPEFSLIRKHFLQAVSKNRTIEAIENVLICFGGSDYKNLTVSTLILVARFSEFKQIMVITGAGFSHLEELNILINADSRIKHYNSVSENEMVLRMQQADLAIVPSSGILLEALSVVPVVISGLYAENQKNIYKNYLDDNCFIDAKNFTENELLSAIKIVLENRNQTTGCKFDGKSGQRLLKVFNQLHYSNTIKLERAKPEHVEITFKWASNPIIRAYSFNQNNILWEEHLSWYENKINDPYCVFYIALQNTQPVGSIRYDIKDDEAVISYLIDPEFHGKGLGQLILNKSLQDLMEEKLYYKFKNVIGYVMKENIPSVKAFERLGFTKNDLGDKLKFEKRIRHEEHVH